MLLLLTQTVIKPVASVLFNVLQAHRKALCDFSCIWTSEMQTQDLLISATLTYHLGNKINKM